MKFKVIEVKKPFVLKLKENTFLVRELKVNKNRFIAKGVWEGGRWPQRATVSGFCEKPVLNCNIPKVKEYVLDTEEPLCVDSYPEAAEILGTNSTAVFRLHKEGFLKKGAEGWNEYDLIRIKPFFKMSKRALLGELIRRELYNESKS